MIKKILLLLSCFVMGSGLCLAAEPYQREIRNVTLTDSALWYEVDCGDAASSIDRVRKINIRCRQDADMRVSFDAAGATYFTVPAGQTYFEDSLGVPLVFYLQSLRDGDEAEVIIYR